MTVTHDLSEKEVADTDGVPYHRRHHAPAGAARGRPDGLL
jgi:hypothetical protein